MAVDVSKLKKLGRRGLGAPPTDGSPGIEESVAPPLEVPAAPAEAAGEPEAPFTLDGPSVPVFLRPEYRDRAGAVTALSPEPAAPAVSPPAAETSAIPPLATEAAQAHAANPVASGAGGRESTAAPGPEAEEDEEAAPAPRRTASIGPERGEPEATQQRRQRAPRPQEEPRIPFTTRVSVSTKERLEEACYHLRVKHQAFIDEAIRAHLEKHGF
jgi:hypothetical protein